MGLKHLKYTVSKLHFTLLQQCDCFGIKRSVYLVLDYCYVLGAIFRPEGASGTAGMSANGMSIFL